MLCYIGDPANVLNTDDWDTFSDHDFTPGVPKTIYINDLPVIAVLTEDGLYPSACGSMEFQVDSGFLALVHISLCEPNDLIGSVVRSVDLDSFGYDLTNSLEVSTHKGVLTFLSPLNPLCDECFEYICCC
jgi:hypothetical protein